MTPFFCAKPELNRHVVFPLQHPDLYALYEEHFAAIWKNTDVVYDNDRFHELSKDEQHFIKHVIAFFAGSDGIVMDNIEQRLLREVTCPEVRLFYSIQNFMEGVHAQTYADLITTYIDDAGERDRLFQAIETSPIVRMKAEWGMRYTNDPSVSILELLMALSLIHI